MKAQLVRVHMIHSTESAFAAQLENGLVVTWGNPETGGNSREVQDQLLNW